MAFYGERFRRKDEEDIWEELKRMLMNPIPKEEMTLKQQQEQAKIDTIHHIKKNKLLIVY